MAQATVAPAAKTVPAANEASPVADLAARIGELESAIAALKAPKRFIVLGLFRYADQSPQQLRTLPSGQTSGLPTADYDWPCNDCRKVGNLRWHATTKSGNAPPAQPEGWAWTHVGAKSFASAFEANSWLDDTEEGRFVKANAAAIMTFTTTDYSPVAAGSIATTRLPRIQ